MISSSDWSLLRSGSKNRATNVKPPRASGASPKNGEHRKLPPCSDETVAYEHSTTCYPLGERRATSGSTSRMHALRDRKSTRLNSSHLGISYAVFCLKK